jgi:hypothetical protein
LRLSNTRVRQGASFKASIFYAYEKHIKKVLDKNKPGARGDFISINPKIPVYPP